MDGEMIATAPVRLPPRIALVGLDEDLGGYLRDWFAVHWPEARVVVRARGLRLVADLVVVDHEPEQSPQLPTLWLAEIDRSQSRDPIGSQTLAHRDADHRATLEAGDAGVFA